MTDSQGFHEAHLAFFRATIVAKSASGEPILTLLKKYTEDVRRAERDKLNGERDARVHEEIDEALTATSRPRHWGTTEPRED